MTIRTAAVLCNRLEGRALNRPEVTLWRADGGVPDDAVLLRVAEKVLPTVPRWAADG